MYPGGGTLGVFWGVSGICGVDGFWSVDGFDPDDVTDLEHLLGSGDCRAQIALIVGAPGPSQLREWQVTSFAVRQTDGGMLQLDIEHDGQLPAGQSFGSIERAQLGRPVVANLEPRLRATPTVAPVIRDQAVPQSLGGEGLELGRERGADREALLVQHGLAMAAD